MHQTLTATLLLCCMCSVIACKHGAPSDTPDTVPTSPDTAAAAEAPLDPPSFMGALPLEEQRTILIAAGCEDDDALTASTCTFCPAERDGASPPSAVTILPGQFGDSRGAVVLAKGCGGYDGAMISSLVAVQQDASGEWGVMGRKELSGVVRCEEGLGRGGISHTICLSELSRYGTRSSYYELLDWTSVTSGEEKEPIKTTLVELSEHQSCEKNMGIAHQVVGPTYQDSDGDGISEILITVTTTMGPFTGTLDTCPEEGFAAALTPPRDTRTMTTEYIYEQIENGVKERHDRSTYISLGEEFETLMEQ